MRPADDGVYLGRYRQGQTVPLRLWCRDADMSQVMPDRTPSARVACLSAGSGFAGLRPYLAVSDPVRSTALFSFPLFIPHEMPPGHYVVIYGYSIGGRTFTIADYFEVVAGGDGSGTVISLFGYAHPEANFVLAHLSCGRIVQGRNPSI